MLPTGKDESSTQSQLYKVNFKRWMKLQAPKILPALVPGVQYKQAIGMKVIPLIIYPDTVFQDEDEDEPHTILYTDVVFQVEYEGKPCTMYMWE